MKDDKQRHSIINGFAINLAGVSEN